MGLALNCRECIVLTSRRRGEIEEHRSPALAQVKGREVSAIGQKAYRLVGKSNDIVCVFPGRLEDPTVLSAYLEKVFPRISSIRRPRVWASVPTAFSVQMQLDLRNSLDACLSVRETVLVPEILAAALGSGFPLLRSEEETHRARMVVHIGSTRISSGVFVDGNLAGLTVREGSWHRLVREVQENLQFRFGTTLGFNTFYKVVRTLSRSFFDRQLSEPSRPKPFPATPRPDPDNGDPPEQEPAAEVLPDVNPPSNLRSFSERGLIEYVIEDETISRSIDIQLKNFLFGLEKVVLGCFSQLRADGRGEIASDLFSDRIVLCGDIFFEPAALARHFSRLTRFRFEPVSGNPVTKGLRRILSADVASKKAYRGLASLIHEDGGLFFSRV
ncbi:MAG: rod shape-determining protein [Acidobacteriota bacterium]